MSSIFKRSHKTTCHFLPNFLTKKNLTRGNAALIRSRHAGHRVAPRHGQSGPEWGHGAHRRQRRTYRTFSFFIPYFSLLCCSLSLHFFPGRITSRAAVKTDRTCDVSFSFSYALTLLLSRASASKPSSRTHDKAFAFSFFKRSLLMQ